MKKAYLFLLLFLCLSTISAFSQSQDNIFEQKPEPIYKQKRVRQTPKQLLGFTKSDSEAYQEAKIAESMYNASSVFKFTGGFLIGYPIGTAISGGKPDWTLAGFGAGLLAVAIPFQIGFTKHATKAVNLYNSNLRQNTADIKLGFAPNGMELKLVF